VRPLALACFASLLLVATAAPAQPADGPQRAIALGHEAMNAYGKGDWATAYEHFADAEAAAHSPVFVLYMARCKRSQGELLAARELLARTAGEALPDSAPEPWQRARADAARMLSELEPRIPSILVALRGGGAVSDGAASGPKPRAALGGALEPAMEPAITLDGAPVSAEARRAPIRVNPGAHTLAATLPGRAPITSTVRVAEGDPPLKIELSLDPDPAPPPVAPPAITPPPPPVAPPRKRGSLTPGLVALGVGGAGLAAGGILGGVALSVASGVKGNCKAPTADSLVCPPAEQPNVNRANTLATASTATFIAGGAIAAAGVVLILVRPGGSETTARLVPGPGWLSVQGTF
jgi:hypothetical protein